MQRQILPTNCQVIIGSGALGLFLANDCISKQVIVIHRKAVPKPIIFSSNQKTSPLSKNIIFYDFTEFTSKLKNIKNIDTLNLTFYICVHPHQITDIVLQLNELLTNFGELQASIVFCNNGFVPEETLKLFTPSIYDKINIIRALFFAGVMRNITEKETMVIHSGGNLVRYGNLHGTANLPKFHCLTWEYVPNIDFMEASKFFTNFILGYYIYDKNIPNIELFKQVSQEQITQIAQKYCELFTNQQYDYHEVMHLLVNTITQTAQNINSITRALLNNNNAPWQELCTQLQYLLMTNTTLEQKTFWDSLLNNHRCNS